MPDDPISDSAVALDSTPPQKRPFQFTLRQLLIWVAWVAVACSLIAVATQTVQSLRASARAALCQNNLRQLALGLANHHEHRGSFPAACVSDANGRPLHSWRVLITTYLDSINFYGQYMSRPNEPWDSPYHAALTKRFDFMTFHCPAHGVKDANATHYVAVIGPETMWPGVTPSNRSWAVSDDTLLLTEFPDLGIHWAEPRDITVDEFVAIVRDLKLNPEKRPHRDGLNYVTVGGEVKTLSYDTTEEELRELVRAVPTP